MQRDIEQSTLARCRDVSRKTIDRLGIKRTAANAAQAARPLSDEHVSSGQKGNPPGMIQALRDGNDAELMLARALD